MSEFNESIELLQSRLEEVDKMGQEMRYKQIENDLSSGSIDLTDLSDHEQIFIHTKLHFYYNMKSPPITTEQIVSIHKELTGLMKSHTDYDNLDKK